LNLRSKFAIRGIFSVALVLLCCSLSYGDAVWTGNVNSAWENNSNWTDNTGPVDADYVNISSGTVNFSSASGDSPSLRGIRQSGGRLNISGGTLEVAQLASAFSTFDGEVVQSGGFASINTIEVGSTLGGSGSLTVNGEQKRLGQRQR